VLLAASQPIWSLPLEGVHEALQTTPEGLDREEAEWRLAHFGPNRLPPAKRRHLALRFLDQMVHFMALLLWIAGGLAFAAGTPQLGWAIWAVVLINGVFSFWQEFQAERTLAALTRALPSQVQVWRDGQLGFLPAEELVAGDRIRLEKGDRVPADCRVSVAHALYLDLSVLTGESLPVARRGGAIEGNQRLAKVSTSERANLVMAGSTVTSGRGEAFVYATGAETEFGQVARLAAGTTLGASTLEVQVSRIVQTICTIAVTMGVIAFGLSVLLVGMAPLESVVFATGIIVANVPEGLLPTVTLALAMAVQRMASRRALVRRLSAVEALGSVSVICSDKTGTLTGNRMAVESTWLPLPAEGLERLLLRAASLCSNARLEAAVAGAGGATEPRLGVGDPTETAMLVAAAAAGLVPDALPGRHPRRREIPFDSLRRRMTVLVGWSDHADDLPIVTGGSLLITKGAPLEVLAHCTSWLSSSGDAPLDAALHQRVVDANDDLASRGFRVIAVALRRGEGGCGDAPAEALERAQMFLGLLGLYDPPRPEVPDAIRQCREAGIKVTMVTGDYGLTAQAIAQQIGLLDPSGSPGRTTAQQQARADPVRVIEGSTLAQISDVQLRQLLKYRRRLVFARMAPEQKLRLVQAYRALGEVAATSSPAVSAMKCSMRSRPEEMPADVQIAPSRVKRSSTTSTSPRARRRSREAQWVVARRPLSRPAACSRKAPVQTESTARQLADCCRMKAISSALATSVRVPWPPGTSSTSSGGADAKLTWGSSCIPLAQVTGPSAWAISRH